MGVNSLENIESNEARERILNASIQLFSKKGYDATRVNEIADAASVNKALIYYYFKSKEEILDHLVKTVLDSIASLALDFIQNNIVQMIKDGLLDIESDRLRFVNKQAMESFLQKMYHYYDKMLEYMLVNRHLIRIMMLESLKDSKHHNALFCLLDLTKESVDNPLFRTIWDADKDFTYSRDMALYKFFFGSIPVISFAVYYDDYKTITKQSDQDLRSSFLRSCQIMNSALVSENEILLLNKST